VTRPTVLCIAGPTAAGKTNLALEIAARYPVEIISVDSAMVYRGLDIGTAKPSIDERRRVRHHLIDIREPEERYSAGNFRQDALALIRQIQARGCLPLLVGGTLLYFRALMQGLAELPPGDPKIRSALDARAETEGWPALHAELKLVDPVAAAKIAPTDRQRIQRALEVHAISGRPISDMQRDNPPPPAIDFLAFAFVPVEREILYRRIEARFDQMLRDGLLNEVRGLLARPGMRADLPALRAVGYRQLAEHLAGECGLDDARQQALTATRRYAKRQLTWLRAEPRFQWLGAGAAAEVDKALSRRGQLDALSGSTG